MFNDFLLTLSFLTTIPVGKKLKYSENLGMSVVFFPCIGNIIGIMNYIIFLVFNKVFNGYLLVLTLVLFEFLFSGALHLDGLADTFDGLCSARSKEKMLEIMKDSRIGTHGVLAIVFCVLFKLLLLHELADELIYYIIAMPIVSRGLACVFMYNTHYPPKHDGIASPFVGKMTFSCYVTTLILTFMFTFFAMGSKVVVLLLATIIFNYAYKAYCVQKIDGITGDIIGSGIELSEIFFLLSGLIYNLIDNDILLWLRNIMLK